MFIIVLREQPYVFCEIKKVALLPWPWYITIFCVCCVGCMLHESQMPSNGLALTLHELHGATVQRCPLNQHEKQFLKYVIHPNRGKGGHSLKDRAFEHKAEAGSLGLEL